MICYTFLIEYDREEDAPQVHAGMTGFGGRVVAVQFSDLMADRDALLADVERLRADAERLDWLTRMVSGNALRWIGVEWFVWSPENARAAIDAALADQEGGR